MAVFRSLIAAVARRAYMLPVDGRARDSARSLPRTRRKEHPRRGSEDGGDCILGSVAGSFANHSKNLIRIARSHQLSGISEALAFR